MVAQDQQQRFCRGAFHSAFKSLQQKMLHSRAALLLFALVYCLLFRIRTRIVIVVSRFSHRANLLWYFGAEQNKLKSSCCKHTEKDKDIYRRITKAISEKLSNTIKCIKKVCTMGKYVCQFWFINPGLSGILLKSIGVIHKDRTLYSLLNLTASREWLVS